MDRPSLYLASISYGGLASAGFMRAVLDLRAACAARDIPLQLDLMGGEALASRGEAMILRRFLTSGATHLLVLSEPAPFDAAPVVAHVRSGADDVPIGEGGRLLSARRVQLRNEERGDHALLFGDVRGSTGPTGTSRPASR